MSTTGQAVTCCCGGRFQAPAQLAGRRVSCPACGKPIDVPALADSPLDAAALAMQSLPAADPLRRPAVAASPAAVRRPVPLGLWIGLGAGGAALVLVLVILLALWNAGQRLIAQNMAKEKERQAARQAAGLAPEQPVTKTDGPQVYKSILTTTEITAPGQRGREVTYESQTKQGGRMSGRYRVLITDREIISLEWVAAPAKAEPAEVARFFDSFKLDAN